MGEGQDDSYGDVTEQEFQRMNRSASIKGFIRLWLFVSGTALVFAIKAWKWDDISGDWVLLAGTNFGIFVFAYSRLERAEAGGELEPMNNIPPKSADKSN